jgi:hypothetical protein
MVVVGSSLWSYMKIKEEKAECELHRRHMNYYCVEVNKRAEKAEQSRRNKSIGRGDRG